MRQNAFVAAVALVAASSGIANADCAFGSHEIDGNWYCQPVNAITYQNFGGTGTYNKITNMDPATGSCSSKPFEYSGPLAPLNGEVSMHFRGPLNLKQFAVYVPSSSNHAVSPPTKRTSSQRRHGHAKFHHRGNEVMEAQRLAEAEKRAVGDMVTATINGVVVSWVNEYGGPAAATEAPKPAVHHTHKLASPTGVKHSAPAIPNSPHNLPIPAAKHHIGSLPAIGSSLTTPQPGHALTVPGDWAQTAYYNAASGTEHGLVFLNNKGGQGSGTFDMEFGNSLSYASADGISGSASPHVLADRTLPSNEEVIIMTDRECHNGDCGFVRPGTVAYHGFGGAHKIFLLEFGMPNDGTTGWNMNMPAVWMLNAQIPRTLQYGKADCSCWESGCGEFDLFEVLNPGNNRCKSTLHGNVSGGSSDFFRRPTNGTIKAAVVMSGTEAHIKILDNSYVFKRDITNIDVQLLASNSDNFMDNLGVSKFVLTG